MPTLNGKYWEDRYQSKDMPWEKGEASPGLIDFLDAHPELERGTVCVPGCGTGHDVRAWATADGKPLLIYSDSHKVASGSSA